MVQCGTNSTGTSNALPRTHTQPRKYRCGIYREVTSSLCVEVQLTMKAYSLVLILLPVLILRIQGLGELVLHIRIIYTVQQC